ncbi:MAG TPA: FAD synthase [Candidatus Magasanikbacteria bacterium]|nr:FAD synthase [Candidatus Magasanikbacteria bacterium]
MSKIVMVFGTFDIVHLGHLHMFNEARGYGDECVAVVARDVNVEKIRGQAPYNDENARAEFLRSIRAVDRVVLGSIDNPYAVVVEVKPDIIALGYDQKIYVDKLAEALVNFGLSTEIVRLRPFSPDKYKTTVIKNYCQKHI